MVIPAVSPYASRLVAAQLVAQLVDASSLCKLHPATCELSAFALHHELSMSAIIRADRFDKLGVHHCPSPILFAGVQRLCMAVPPAAYLVITK